MPLQLFCKPSVLLKLKIFIGNKGRAYWDKKDQILNLQKFSVAREKLIIRQFAKSYNGYNGKSAVILQEETSMLFRGVKRKLPNEGDLRTHRHRERYKGQFL